MTSSEESKKSERDYLRSDAEAWVRDVGKQRIIDYPMSSYQEDFGDFFPYEEESVDSCASLID